jgi:hypothetical protein
MCQIGKTGLPRVHPRRGKGLPDMLMQAFAGYKMHSRAMLFTAGLRLIFISISPPIMFLTAEVAIVVPGHRELAAT